MIKDMYVGNCTKCLMMQNSTAMSSKLLSPPMACCSVSQQRLTVRDVAIDTPAQPMVDHWVQAVDCCLPDFRGVPM